MNTRGKKAVFLSLESSQNLSQKFRVTSCGNSDFKCTYLLALFCPQEALFFFFQNVIDYLTERYNDFQVSPGLLQGQRKHSRKV